MKNRLVISLFVGILISSAAVYLSFRNVPFRDLLEYLHTINYLWILPSLFFIVLTFILRAIRWQIILSANVTVNFSAAYHPLVIGFMLNCILPGRVGEVARPIILNRKNQVSFPTGLATVAAERIFDAGFLICFLALALNVIPMDTALDISYGKYHLSKETLVLLKSNLVRLCALLLAVVIALAFDTTRNAINRAIDRLPYIIFFFLGENKRKWVRSAISGRIVRLINHVSNGLLLFKSPRKLIACTAMTLLIWFLTAFSYYAMVIGCPGIGLSPFELTFVMVIIAFFIALPSVPGYWGLWEAGGIFALSLFGVSSQAAAGFTLANHAVQLFPVIIMGLLSTFSLSINIRQLSHLPERR
jgi:uncharacterized protein (TIRG00374 family)